MNSCVKRMMNGKYMSHTFAHLNGYAIKIIEIFMIDSCKLIIQFYARW